MSANEPTVAIDAYVVVGVATCFIKEEGKLQPIQVIEPIPSAALEALCKGIETSYTMAIAAPLNTFFADGQGRIPQSFPADAQFCEDFEERLMAASRSYRTCASAQALLPLGSLKTDFNHSTERKRTLNLERVVNTEDNVKQHAYTHQVL